MIAKLQQLAGHKFLFPVVFFFVATIFFTWPQVPNIATKITDGGDPYFVSWVMKTGVEKILKLDFANFWESNIFYPYPDTIAFSDHSLTLSLQALPVYLADQSSIVLINWTQLLAFFLSGVFGYFLVLYYTQSKKAALVGGIIFAFSPYHFGKNNHLQITSYQYIPLLILFWERLLRWGRLKDGFIFGIAFILNAFVSVYLMVFSLIPLAVIILVRLLNREITINKRRLAVFILTILFVAAVTLPLLLPYLRISSEHNIVRSVEEVRSGAARPKDYLVSLPNHIYWGETSKNIIPTLSDFNPNERSLFFGFAALALAAAAFIGWRKIVNQKKFRFNITATHIIFFLTAVIAVILSFGPYIEIGGHRIFLPGNFLYEKVFIFKAIRVPARLAIIALLSISVLAAIGFGTLVDSLRRRAFTLFLMGLIAFESIVIPMTLYPPPPPNIEMAKWTAENLESGVAIAHIPFYRGLVDFLRIYDYDKRPMINGYSGIFPEGIRKVMDKSSGEAFSKNPRPLLEVLATTGVGYLELHRDFTIGSLGQAYWDNLTQSLSKIPEVTKLHEANGEVVYDIQKLENKTFLETQTQASTKLIDLNLVVRRENNTNQSWVNKSLEKEVMEFVYYKDGKLVTRKTREVYKTLFLEAGEYSEIVVEVPKLLPFQQFDKVEVNLLN